MFKNLDLNRDKIIESIEKYSEYIGSDLKYKCEEMQSNRYRWSIESNQESFFIDMFYKNNGKTTIDLSSGDSSELKNNIAEFIRDRCTRNQDFEKFDSWFSAKNRSYDDFIAIIDLIKESEIYLSEQKLNNDLEDKRIISGKNSEKIYVHFYKSKGTILIQGKPLVLFSIARNILCSILNEEEVTDVLNVNYNVAISKSNIENLAKRMYPNSLKRIRSKTVKNMFMQSLYYFELCNKDDFEMFNYTSFVFDSYRALEGVMRQFFFDIELDMQDFKIMTNNGEIEDYVLKCIKLKYNDYEPIVKYLKEFYNFYTKRNKFFHVEKMNKLASLKGIDVSPNIASKSDAQAHINDVLSLIENYYTNIK